MSCARSRWFARLGGLMSILSSSAPMTVTSNLRSTRLLPRGSVKIETFSWHDPAQRHRIRQLRPGSGRSIWNTRLGETEFRNCWDLTKYA